MECLKLLCDVSGKDQLNFDGEHVCVCKFEPRFVREPPRIWAASSPTVDASPERRPRIGIRGRQREPSSRYHDRGRDCGWAGELPRNLGVDQLRRIAAIGASGQCASSSDGLIDGGATSVALNILGEDRKHQLESPTVERPPRLQ